MMMIIDMRVGEDEQTTELLIKSRDQEQYSLHQNRIAQGMLNCKPQETDEPINQTFQFSKPHKYQTEHHL